MCIVHSSEYLERVCRMLREAPLVALRKQLTDRQILSACRACGHDFRRRRHDPVVTVFHFLAQAIQREESFAATWQELWTVTATKSSVRVAANSSTPPSGIASRAFRISSANIRVTGPIGVYVVRGETWPGCRARGGPRAARRVGGSSGPPSRPASRGRSQLAGGGAVASGKPLGNPRGSGRGFPGMGLLPRRPETCVAAYHRTNTIVRHGRSDASASCYCGSLGGSLGGTLA